MRSHLTPDQFVDLVEGQLAESDVPHLQHCAGCRAQLEGLRATWAITSAVAVPEPSPLFWDHLSRRVHDAVAADQASAPRRWSLQSWRTASMTAAVAAALALVVAVGGRRGNEGPQPMSPGVAVGPAGVAAPAPADVPFAFENDEPLAMVADLASELDWDTAAELGLSARDGADRMLTDMTEDERVELRRLLTEALETGA